MSRQKNISNYQLTSQYDILEWLDPIPLSRSIHNIESDFADGILIVEIIAYFFPEYVNFDIFHIARNMSQRAKNWRLLNSKILPKINLQVPGTIVHDIINEEHNSIATFLIHLREKIEEHIIQTEKQKFRLQWKTYRSLNSDNYHLPSIFLSSRPIDQASLTRNERLMNQYVDDYDNSLRRKNEEIEILRAKLKRCEKIIQKQDKQIQELQEKFKLK
ncbi:unnamed protein product [Adineta steineri]|uniref:Calponin-homology (CH) domain-containing protein n=1 Tax=Adineta steineri TaxID=433720 RepID=A0A814B4A8_9BILA|nr:unnamed protein product [Adineta steineri]CAF0920820.1 unnamed protein product [Adineta steineri]